MLTKIQAFSLAVAFLLVDTIPSAVEHSRRSLVPVSKYDANQRNIKDYRGVSTASNRHLALVQHVGLK